MDNEKPFFNIVLVSPEIPGNTGSIGRTCVALNLKLHLIKPLGFDLSEKAVKRAGLDYWKYVNINIYENWDEFLEKNNPDPNLLFFFSKFGSKNYFTAEFKENCYLIFGSETLGLPLNIQELYENRLYLMPMYSEHIRSLNLSNVVTAASYEALRKIKF